MESLRRFFVPRTIIITLAFLLMVSATGAVYFYRQATADPQKAGQQDLENTIKKVGRLMVLPEGEQPTLATVSDPEKLRDQQFFANAQKGDKVLVYTNARKAILYSVSLNKIIEVGPINTSAGDGATPAP